MNTHTKLKHALNPCAKERVDSVEIDSLHRDYLVYDAERICKNINIPFSRNGVDNFLVNGLSFDDYKKMLSYVYSKEAKKK
jgi:hypothetical protein